MASAIAGSFPSGAGIQNQHDETSIELDQLSLGPKLRMAPALHLQGWLFLDPLAQVGTLEKKTAHTKGSGGE
jgi:hypothetical protein